MKNKKRYSVSLVYIMQGYSEIKTALEVQLVFANSPEEALGKVIMSDRVTELTKDDYKLSCKVVLNINP